MEKLRKYRVQLRITKLETFEVEGEDAQTIVKDFTAGPDEVCTTTIGICLEQHLEHIEVVSVESM